MRLPHFKTITSANEIICAKQNAVVKLYSAINGASQLLSYALADFAPRYKNQVEFYHVDIDESPAFPEEYHVELLPALLFFKEGRLVDMLTGLPQRTLIASKIDTLLTRS
jgi:thioredoxin 1